MQRRDLLILGASFTVPAAWAQTVGKPDWRPLFFDEHQNETVVALTEAIIPATDTPGAKAALVNRYLDLFLRETEAGPRAAFMSGLNWLDGEAIRRHGHPFKSLTAAQQTALLQTMDAATSGPGHNFFRQAKALTVNVYYRTQIGYQELNKGGRVTANFGCQHAKHA
ncbi:MAG: gluconate 2-dehydrogenase subunit 3 family protein [Bryobacterales bacterium]|nr:gluconate 2-dehydrogenase subunit 3 family protein [Bryobacterales bacterium]